MSLSNAQTYAIRARNSDTPSDVGDAVYRAVDELVREIRDLQDKVARLEGKVRHLG